MFCDLEENGKEDMEQTHEKFLFPKVDMCTMGTKGFPLTDYD